MSAVTEFAGRAGEAGQLVVGHASTAYEAGSGQLEGKSTGWSIIGYALALILLYVLVADSRVVAASSKLVGGAQTAAEAWIAPSDPVALLAERFGATPAASSTVASTSTAASAGGATQTTGGVSAAGGKAPESKAEVKAATNFSKGAVAPSPAAAGNGASAQLHARATREKTITLLRKELESRGQKP